MKTLGYYNGKFDELENMTVPMNDRACWFGDGVYDACPAVNYKMFAIDEHIDRFFNGAALLDIEIPVTKKELKDLLQEMVNKMDTGNLFVYFQVTRGTAIRRHIYPEGKANLWITLRPTEIEHGLEPIKLITVEDTRYLHCNIKTLNLIPSCVAREKARKMGVQEAVFYRPGGRVTECSSSNIHIIREGKFVTAPTDNLILPGIGRAHLIKACKKLGIAVNETPYTLDDLFAAEEIIVSCSFEPCMPVNEIDGKAVGGKNPELLEMLRKEVVNEILDTTK